MVMRDVILIILFATIAAMLLRLGDPGMPQCPQGRVAHVRCAP
jgi:hypothetical protein